MGPVFVLLFVFYQKFDDSFFFNRGYLEAHELGYSCVGGARASSSRDGDGELIISVKRQSQRVRVVGGGFLSLFSGDPLVVFRSQFLELLF